MSTTLLLRDGTRVIVRDDGDRGLELVATQTDGLTEHALRFAFTDDEARSLGSILYRTAPAGDDARVARVRSGQR
jgi:K+/H+ antiporter YhaU regulatory subunit KhtT